MTQDQTPDAAEAVLADEPEVRQALSEADRGHVAGVVAEHASSPLAWVALADVADSESRVLDALAYAVVAVDLAREQLAASGWSPGERVPWAEEANRAYLRALDAERRAAERLGLHDRAERAAADLAAADPEAPARIASEFTPTQLIPVITEPLPPHPASTDAPAGDPSDESAAPGAARED
ncbi:hypothetical protein BCL57_001283 [Agromyces flavus]|uniref:DUF3151 domain-containing protein n=1 Tax=Agromyces flavus TaxID=589382 RepID=A0A1H1ZK09_9MICO|nr:DUF3151 family protein [Agromyces flavus]MCP2367129.1 hypothetical protein [Agromyces flavus]SDT34000.1 Protein of unknown function [Agromyces flavus]